ncbi:MAG TPA: hypothetical protein VL285_11610 [Bryobacteraceae bacterium]|nr:hypothetical protein [Bryobacteraceae bacterium]
MGSRSSSKRRRLEKYLRERPGASLDAAEWHELIALLAPVSTSYLRGLLHEAGVGIAQPFDGARLTSFEELERSLLEMEKVYTEAVASGNRALAAACRQAVIQAKDRARLIARNSKVEAEKRRQKEQMVEWLLVWLENPGIFETWAALRKRAAATCPTAPG